LVQAGVHCLLSLAGRPLGTWHSVIENPSFRINLGWRQQGLGVAFRPCSSKATSHHANNNKVLAHCQLPLQNESTHQAHTSLDHQSSVEMNDVCYDIEMRNDWCTFQINTRIIFIFLLEPPDFHWLKLDSLPMQNHATRKYER